MDISVIVPVYNSEKNLSECVESLLAQTLRSVEFIFVDDGSTDRSAEILEDYRRRDDRIRILRQQNLYAGVARNAGLEAAVGKYVIFLDSDDFFEPTLLESAFRCAESNQAEIVIFGFSRYNERTGKSAPNQYNSSLPDGVFSVDKSEALLDGLFFIRCNAAPWNKLFLRSFIEKHGLRFQAIRKCNDMYFVFMSLILAERMVYLDRILVHYRIGNENSLQGNKNADRESYIDCGISVKKKAIELNRYHGIVKASLNDYAVRLVQWGLQGGIQFEAYRSYYNYVKQHLIPDLFDSPEDFAENRLVTDFYRSRDFAEFLFFRLQESKARLQSTKESKDYRVGRTLLRVPRRVKRLFHKKK